MLSAARKDICDNYNKVGDGNTKRLPSDNPIKVLQFGMWDKLLSQAELSFIQGVQLLRRSSGYTDSRH